MDPNNGATTCTNAIGNLCFYVFASNYAASTGNRYELDTSMESTKYKTGGGSDVESNTKDGGTDNDWYEVGNYLAL